MGPAVAMGIKYGVPIAASLLGGMGGKDRAKRSAQPTRTTYNNTQQRTPWDFDPEMEGNQGADMLASLLSAWGGLLGNIGPSPMYKKSVNQGLSQFLA